ncbi:MAG TPA: DUF2207 domain-containing protein, partial [Thermoanaerobaculia bacterium]|nr:DUF2207 domain-containing protein [Thermoanaerobaculia bacterium]
MGANSIRAMLLALLVVPPVSAKSLYWRTFDVTARLDAAGALHVREQQGMVFDGDWNGGERTFNLLPGQKLEIERIVRVENGRDIPLERGLDAFVNQWEFVGDNVIRWRSRRTTDPPFHNQEITYAIEYVLTGVLEKTATGAKLHHDFAFPARSGEIQDFSLRLDIAPAWRGVASPVIVHRQNIPPGQGVYVDADLTWAGQGQPAGVHSPPSLAHSGFYALLLAIIGAVLTLRFYRDEAQKGRFQPLPAETEVNQAFLDRYVFSMPPEAIGYAWDEVSGAPEVGAVLARMEHEQKIKTWTTGSVLHLQLLADWQQLPPGERDLVQALFLGKSETDTDQIKAYYRSTGFQPQKLIQPMIDSALAQIPEWKDPPRSLTTGEVLTFVGALLFGWLAFTSKPLQVILFLGLWLFAFGVIAAFVTRRRVDVKPWGAVAMSWAMLALGAGACFFAVQREISDIISVFILISSACFASVLLMIARTRESLAKIALRRRLASAREHFEMQLRSAKPNLRDEWYPYLIAFGLGPNVDQWFHQFAAAGIASGIAASSFGGSSFGSSSSSSTASWTGGGG